MAACDKCLHKPVCGKFQATGGHVNSCEHHREDRRGEWEMVDEYCRHAKEFRCTACGAPAYYDHYTRSCDYDFCPNCGADMRGEGDGDHLL